MLILFYFNFLKLFHKLLYFRKTWNKYFVVLDFLELLFVIRKNLQYVYNRLKPLLLLLKFLTIQFFFFQKPFKFFINTLEKRSILTEKKVLFWVKYLLYKYNKKNYSNASSKNTSYTSFYLSLQFVKPLFYYQQLENHF